MCIAIMSPQDVTIPYDNLKESFLSNPDGAGFMYAEGDKLHIEKGFMDFESFYQAYAPHAEKPCAIHFRIKTHGKVDGDNTHPFQVGKHLGVIHNGIISNVDCTDNPDMSDTYHFNKKFLAPIYKKDGRFPYKDHFKGLIKSYIGYSKLVFLNNKGHFSIINEAAGNWDEGAWYSNNSYKKTSFFQPKKSAAQPKKEGVIAPVVDPIPTFHVGCRVRITTERETQYGTLQHFTGGLMAGILIDGQSQYSLVPLARMEPLPPVATNPFKADDWVVRVDDPDGKIGVVTGTSKNLVWVEWMSRDFAEVDTKTYVLNADKLQHYDFTSDY